jgi:hypothetical protein
MSIFLAIMFAPVALFFGFLLIRLLMEPATWIVLICGLGLFLALLVAH